MTGSRVVRTGEPATVALGWWPTPVQPVDDGLWIKREDQCCFAFGGTKVRALEPILARAIESGVRSVVTGGRRDSNWLALMAFAARRLGLQLHAVVDPGSNVTTSIRLMALWGARIHESEAPGAGPVNAQIARLADTLDAHPVPRAGASAAGVVGYAPLAAEILEAVPAGPVDVVVGVGSGALAAGLALGFHRRLGAGTAGDVRICAIPAAGGPDDAWRAIGRLAHVAGPAIAAAALRRVEVLPRIPSGGAAAAIASRAGVLLDPVFVGPAWQGYLSVPRTGRAAILVASGGLTGFLDDVAGPPAAAGADLAGRSGRRESR